MEGILMYEIDDFILTQHKAIPQDACEKWVKHTNENIEVLKQFKNQKYQPEIIIDAGNLKSSKPSTVIDLTSSKFKTLRP